MSDRLNEKIREKYYAFVTELEQKAPKLLIGERSNLFVIGVPNDWQTAKNRVMIVGEEASFGAKVEYDDEIAACQQWTIEYLSDQIYEKRFGNKTNKSSFWTRFRAVVNGFMAESSSFCYANIDCLNNPQTRRRLSEKDRRALHSTSVKLLNEVVELIKPTVVVFFGWHWTSLRHEFEELYSVLWARWSAEWFARNGAKFRYDTDNRVYLATYHPRYPIAKTTCYGNCTEYDAAIVEEIKEICHLK